MKRVGFLPGHSVPSFGVDLNKRKVGCGCGGNGPVYEHAAVNAHEVVQGNAQQVYNNAVSASNAHHNNAAQGSYLNGVPFNPQSSWDYTVQRFDGYRQQHMQQRYFNTPERSAYVNSNYINGCRRC